MNEVSDIVLFFGRFHPLLVHLPIGFLFFAFLLEVISKWKKNPSLTTAIPLALLLGALSALGSCILGYMLSLSGDYDESAVDIHFWFGIATTVVAFIAWLIRIEKINIPNTNTVKANISTLTLIVVLLSVTGHYGGNLTHGSDYLVKYLPVGKEPKKELPAISKIEDAGVYDYLVDPILQNKCTSCHNPSKKKGGLSFVDSTAILAGGKNGDALIPGNSSKSEMIKRVLLDPHHDDFMPPEGKTPLTEEEVAILMYWIDNANANFSSQIKGIETPENITKIASNFLEIPIEGEKGTTKLPAVNPINEETLIAIKKEGFQIRELVFESNIYEVVLPPQTITAKNSNELDKKLALLTDIKENILWFYAENNSINDSHLKLISEFVNLQKLNINSNPITDNGIAAFENHAFLNSVNLYGTKVTKKSLVSFTKMKNLQNVYAWKTAIKNDDITSTFKGNQNAPKISLGL